MKPRRCAAGSHAGGPADWPLPSFSFPRHRAETRRPGTFLPSPTGISSSFFCLKRRRSGRGPGVAWRPVSAPSWLGMEVFWFPPLVGRSFVPGFAFSGPPLGWKSFLPDLPVGFFFLFPSLDCR